MKKNSIAVLMCAYNGASYIREQIDSIFQQTKVDVHLFIQDDKSTDDTVAIVNDYIEKGYKIVLLENNYNKGPKRSFKELMRKVLKEFEKYSYYAFADQDDIWLPLKLANAIELLDKVEGPVLYGSNQYIYIDEERQGLRFVSNPETDFFSTLYAHKISGCTMVFNRELAEIFVDKLDKDDRILDLGMHDTWMAVTALLTGQYIYDNKSYILYRIHNNNVVGIRKENISKKIKVQSDRLHYKQTVATIILNCFEIEDKEIRDILVAIALYNKNIRNRMRIIKYARKNNYFGMNKEVFFAKVFLGLL